MRLTGVYHHGSGCETRKSQFYNRMTESRERRSMNSQFIAVRGSSLNGYLLYTTCSCNRFRNGYWQRVITRCEMGIKEKCTYILNQAVECKHFISFRVPLSQRAHKSFRFMQPKIQHSIPYNRIPLWFPGLRTHVANVSLWYVCDQQETDNSSKRERRIDCVFFTTENWRWSDPVEFKYFGLSSFHFDRARPNSQKHTINWAIKKIWRESLSRILT